MSTTTTNNNHSSLEQRVAAALTSATPVGAQQLADLIAETEQAITDADAIAARQQQRALDPVRSPDAARALEQLQFAEFGAKRLRHMLPRLQQQQQQVVARKRAARWTAAADTVQTQRDALANEFNETYPTLVTRSVDLFERILAMDQQVAKVNRAAPNSESRRLLPIGLHHIAANTKLLDLAGQPIWPPATPPILPQDVMPVLSHPGPNWHEELVQRTHARAQEAQKVRNYYATQTKQREDRDAAQAKAERQRMRNGGSA